MSTALALPAPDDDDRQPAEVTGEAVPDTSQPAPVPAPRKVIYATAVYGPGERRDIIPAPLRRENLRGTVEAWAGLNWHRARYHGLRSPLYLLACLIWAVIGAARLAARLIRWGLLTEQHWLRNDAAAEGDSAEWRRLHKIAQDTRKTRGWVIACGLAGALIIALWLALAAPLWAGVLAAVVAGIAGARFGRPAGHSIIGPAVVPPQYEPPTQDSVTAALGALGISNINKAIKDGPGIRFVSPVMRDGPGWGVQLDLPAGVTAGDIISLRPRLASGLRRPLSATWPEGVPEEHEGRLSLWVGFHDISKQKPPKWPLAKAGQADVFAGLPFGTDPRLRPVTAPLFEVNWLIGASPGQGKALALGTPVPTPAGWSTMGELRDGDTVYGADGQPCTVLRAWPVREGRPCYEVEFSDGTVIVADADHLWLADTRASRASAAAAAMPKRRESPFSRDQKHRRIFPQVVTTAEMIGSLRAEGDRRANYSIRVATPLQAPDAVLPVPPYTLGAWLGDGTTSSGDITNPDPEVIAAIEAEGEACARVTVPSNAGKCPQYRIAGLRPRLREIGVLGNKHIPVSYLRASEAQRRALLAGLLDTDGYCCKWGEVQFSVTCEQLARDVHHLVASLGYKVGLRSKAALLYGKDCGTAWIVQFTPADKVFTLPRKVARQVVKVRATAAHRYVTAIRPMPSVPVRCITVDSTDSLYLVGATCVPTHNTAAVRVLALGTALDPLADMWVHELAGKGDLEPLAQVCDRYVSGLDDDSIAYAADSARRLRADLEARSRAFGKLPKDVRGRDGKITRELAARGFRPLVVIFDEVQNLFMHPEYGEQAADDLAYVIRLGRALGIIVILATQRPDKDSLPTAIRGIVTARFCLKVPDYDSNDMILGTGAYKAGYNAAIFRAKTDAGLGWLKGDGDPQVIRTYYLDLPAAERIAARARVMRERAGVLTGYALGLEDEAAAPRDVLADLLAVFCDDAGMQWGVAADRLAGRFPDRWADATAEALSAQCRSLGVKSVDVRMDGAVLKGCRRVAVEQARS